MDNVNYNPLFAQFVMEKKLLDNCYFTLIDIGCSGGIDNVWRVFNDRLVAYGFDPQTKECERLNSKENNVNIKYLPYYVGLSDDHEYMVQKRIYYENNNEYFNPFKRSSSQYGIDGNFNIKVPPPQSNIINEHLGKTKISIDNYTSTNNIQDIDFIKIDTDGNDYEALLSCEESIGKCNVLGFMIETPFTGSSHFTENTFHNIDRYMRRKGFCLYWITVNQYTRASLPGKFRYDIFAQTTTGQPLWADIVYLRDGAAPDYQKIWKIPLITEKLLKLACLYEIYNLQDCVIELLQTHYQKLRNMLPMEEIMNILTPKLHGESLSYTKYIERFHADPEQFFPGYIHKMNNLQKIKLNEKSVYNKLKRLFFRL